MSGPVECQLSSARACWTVRNPCLSIGNSCAATRIWVLKPTTLRRDQARCWVPLLSTVSPLSGADVLITEMGLCFALSAHLLCRENGLWAPWLSTACNVGSGAHVWISWPPQAVGTLRQVQCTPRAHCSERYGMVQEKAQNAHPAQSHSDLPMSAAVWVYNYGGDQGLSSSRSPRVVGEHERCTDDRAASRDWQQARMDSDAECGWTPLPQCRRGRLSGCSANGGANPNRGHGRGGGPRDTPPTRRGEAAVEGDARPLLIITTNHRRIVYRRPRRFRGVGVARFWPGQPQSPAPTTPPITACTPG